MGKIRINLTLSWRRSLSYRNLAIDLLCRSIDRFLYDRKEVIEIEIFHRNLYRIELSKAVGFWVWVSEIKVVIYRMINSLNAKVAIMYKPVNWFTLQISLLVYIWWQQYRTQSIFGDTVYSCYCKFRLVTPYGKFLILTNLDRWKRHFREQNYIENYFDLL